MASHTKKVDMRFANLESEIMILMAKVKGDPAIPEPTNVVIKKVLADVRDLRMKVLEVTASM